MPNIINVVNVTMEIIVIKLNIKEFKCGNREQSTVASVLQAIELDFVKHVHFHQKVGANDSAYQLFDFVVSLSSIIWLPFLFLFPHKFDTTGCEFFDGKTKRILLYLILCNVCLLNIVFILTYRLFWWKQSNFARILQI